MNGPRVTCTDDRTVEGVTVDLERCAALARTVLVGEGAPANVALDMALVDRSVIAELNEHHLGGTGPTDVLSFPMFESDELDGLDRDDDEAEPAMLGDIVVCIEVVDERRGAEGLDDAADLMIVHGTLHILGHDHDIAERAAIMRAKESHYLGRSTPTAAPGEDRL